MAVDLEHGADVTAERHVIGLQLEAAAHGSDIIHRRSQVRTDTTPIASSSRSFIVFAKQIIKAATIRMYLEVYQT